MGSSLRWLGHSAFQITSDQGTVIFVDPWLDNPFSPIRIEDINVAHAVCVTHDHFDHLGHAGQICKRTGAILVAQPELTAGLKTEYDIPDSQIINGMGMNIGGKVNVGDTSISMVQAFHSANLGTPCGYVFLLAGVRIYHTGDTGVFGSMKLIREIYSPDLVLMCIGGVFTMDPFQAVEALKLLAPRKVVPMHYRTFPVLEQSAEVLVDLVQKQVPGTEVICLEPGEEFPI